MSIVDRRRRGRGAARRRRDARPAPATAATPPTRATARRRLARTAAVRGDAGSAPARTGGRRRTSSRMPPTPTEAERQPEQQPGRRASDRRCAGPTGHVEARPSTARRLSAAAVASTARSYASCGAAASIRDLRQPRARRHPLHALVGAQVVEQRGRRGGAVVERQAVVTGRGRQQGRRWSVSRKTSASTRSAPVLPRREDAQRHPRVVGRDRDVDRRAVADCLAALPRPRRRRTPAARKIGLRCGVEVEHLGRVGREAEAVLGGPLARPRRRRRGGR